MQSKKPPIKQGKISRLLTWLLRWLFHLLYHQFAWSYDFVAWMVSLGQWGNWIRAGIPHLDNFSPMILEIGFGPGHLQAALTQKGLHTIGIDQSPQMCRQASRRLRKLSLQPHLINSRAQQLPFPSESIPHIISTFPSEYINDPLTLQEFFRVLTPNGSIIIILFAWITGKNILERLMAWLFHITGETPAWNDQFLEPARAKGFLAYSEITTLPRSKLLLIHLQKPVYESQSSN